MSSLPRGTRIEIFLENPTVKCGNCRPSHEGRGLKCKIKLDDLRDIQVVPPTRDAD